MNTIIRSTVSTLKPGQHGTVTGFSDKELSLKLLEMGLLPGQQVTLKHIAPLGCPLSIEVAGYHLSLRREEAATIYID